MDASFQEDLNADSLDLVELVMEMEDRFKLKIPDEDARELRAVLLDAAGRAVAPAEGQGDMVRAIAELGRLPVPRGPDHVGA